MRILGLDIATMSGWCLVQSEEQPVIVGSGRFTCDPKKGAREHAEIAHCIKMREWVRTAIANWAPQVVAYEHVRFAKFALAHAKWNQLYAAMAMTCLDAGVPTLSLNVGEVKKFATGRGNADKSDMAAALEKIVEPSQVRLMDDNQVDAVWIALLGASKCKNLPRPHK